MEYTKDIQTFGPLKTITKNREKLLKHEIKLELKEFEIQKEINQQQGPANSKKQILNSTYDKYEKKEKEKTLVENIMTNNIITNNMFVNMFSKENLISFFRIPTKYDEINFHSKWWRFYDLCITTCNIVVMLLAIYDYELNFTYPRKLVNEYNIIRILMILISIGAIFCVFKRHYHKQQWRNIKILGRKGLVNYNYNSKMNQNDEDEEVDDFLFQESLLLGGKTRKFFRAGLVYDIIVNLIIPYPRLDFSIYVSGIPVLRFFIHLCDFTLNISNQISN
jgi:uncharacterized protein YhhL (DUF1145 family)